MEPTLFEGDKVICSRLSPEVWATAIKENYVYVLVTNADVIVRRVYNRFAEKKSVEVRSDNKEYENYHLPTAEIREIWYVRAKISPFLPTPAGMQRIVLEEMRDIKKMLKFV